MSDDVNPFRSPETISTPPEMEIGLSGRRAVLFPFASGHVRAMWVVWLFGIGMALDVLGIGSIYGHIQLLGREQAGAEITQEEADSNNLRQGLVALAQIPVALATVVAFLMWMHRAHRNLPALGAKYLRFSPRWAVGGWFVPILNLFRPYQVMAEIWRESEPPRDSSLPGHLSYASSSAIVGWWWALYLAMSFIGHASFRMSLRTESLDEMLISSWIDLVLAAVCLPAALLAIAVARGIDGRQEQCHQALLRSEGGEGPLQSADAPFVWPNQLDG